MKPIVRAGVLILALTITTSSLSAKEFLDLEKIKAQAAAATIEKYPDSDDVLLDDFIQTEYQADGTYESWDDTAVKVLTERGKRDHRTISLSFNTAYGTNYFDRVQIIKPTGAVVEVDPAANSKVMTDRSQMSANIYNPKSKVLTLSVPGLEVGDILRYVIHRVRHKTVVPDTFSDYQTFEHTSPYERTTYQIIGPKELPLVKITLKDEIPGTIQYSEIKSEESDQIIYTWEVTNVPRMFDEPNMPTRYTVVQRLLVSTMENWEDLSKWYWELCVPRLDATTPELEAMAKELVADATNTQQKIDAVFSFVSQDIRYMGITTEDEAPGYEPHDVSMTFSNRYGVCRDKAALLAAMLRIVDVEAFPVIIMAGPKKDEEVPQPFFNHAVTAALGDDGEYILMDSTDENTKDIFPTYLQNMSYIVARPEGDTLRTSPIIPATDNLLRITSTGTLDTEGTLELESRLVFEGINDTAYRGYFSKIKPEERRRFFEGHIKRSMPTAELRSIQILPEELRDTTQPLVIELALTADNLMVEGDESKMLSLPRLGGSLGYANFLIGQTGLDERKYPLYTRMTAGIEETLTLATPANLGAVNVPDYEAIDSDELTWNVRVAATPGSLSATNTFLMNAVEFTPEQYLALKDNLKDIEYNLRKRLIIDLPTEEVVESDIRILERDISIALESKNVWTETQRSKIEVLTYAGTKNNSEVKLAFNPAWQDIELTKAQVTLADGTIKTISEDEINIMDAAWVASAPRYPAAKTLVANLPGVEVGAVIEYEIASKVNGKPFFSTHQSFNAHEPLDRKTMTLTAPESMVLNISNTGIPETTTSSDGTVTYTWMATNQPAVKKEEALPPWHTFNPSVRISSSTWEAHAEAVATALNTAATDQPNATTLANELVDGVKDDRAKAVLIRDWVAKNVRAAGPGLTSLPLSAISPADVTLSDRYGNNPDRMILTHTMLEAAGLNPEFILSGGISTIPEAAKVQLAVPSRTSFGSVLVRVEVGGETIYMSGSSQYAELGTTVYDKLKMLDLSNGEIGTIRVASDKEDRGLSIIEMSVAEDGQIGMTQSSVARGTDFADFNQSYSEMTPEKRRRHYLELVSAVSQSAKAASDLITEHDAYPGRMEYAVVADRYAVADGEYLYFTVPGGLGGLLSYRSNERTLPLAWKRYVDTVSEYNIVLPDGYEPVILPKNFSWQAPHGAGMIEVAVDYSKRANAVRMTLMADLKPALIQAEDFPAIVEASKELSHPDMRTILLKKTK